ncbi:MAG TPA: hypothetical protein DCS30_01275, partial [Rhizobiales bacterium]|nr:hypothetical protein [Hyphomicrobiales bacterium]
MKRKSCVHDLAANVKQDQTSILQEKSRSFGLVNRVRVRIVRADLRTWIGWLLLVLLLFFVLAPIVSLLILALGDAGD